MMHYVYKVPQVIPFMILTLAVANNPMEVRLPSRVKVAGQPMGLFVIKYFSLVKSLIMK
jgi:hypothetical protein